MINNTILNILYNNIFQMLNIIYKIIKIIQCIKTFLHTLQKYIKYIHIKKVIT